MSDIRRAAARGLKPGDSFSVTRTFSAQDTREFGRLTRDYNPVHYHEPFSLQRGFDGLICHGLLAGAMICQIGGQIGWLASGMDFRFLKPVYIGDTITCWVTVTQVDPNGKALANAHFHNQHGQEVLSAQLSGVLPSPAQRAELTAMMAAGDPTNPLFEKD